MDLVDQCPDDVLINIFKHLDLPTRLRASLTCHRWHSLLTDSRCRLENVAVLNLFQSRIWEQNINGGTKERLKPIALDSPRRLSSLAEHVGHVVSLKLWFDDPRFVVRVLRVLRERGLRCRCLDLYPYGRSIPLRAVRELYPDLEALILRPHGPDYFWTGMPFGDCPDFANLDTLVLESLTLTNDVQLPQSVTQMEWSHRDDAAFGGFLDRLERCPAVKYLLIGHVELDAPTCLRLLRIMRRVLRQLLVVVFKFVKFPTIRFDLEDDDESESNSAGNSNQQQGRGRSMIKVIKFDLCYGDIYHTVNEFVANFGEQMQIVGITTILEERQLTGVYRLMPVLKKRDLWLQLGILQRASSSTTLPNSSVLVVPQAAAAGDDGTVGAAAAAPPPDDDDPNPNAAAAAAPNNNDSQQQNLLRPPIELCDTVMKLDVSFVDSQPLLNSILTCGIYKNLLELKFIECKSLTDASLEIVAKFFFRLKRLQLSSCSQCTDVGLTHFVRHWDERRSKQLSIIWRTSARDPTAACTIPALYLRLMLEREKLLTDGGKRMCRIKKRLPSDGDGERVVIWTTAERSNEESSSPTVMANGAGGSVGYKTPSMVSNSTAAKSIGDKVLVFQDYCDNELHWIMGFSLNDDEPDEEDGEIVEE